MKSRQSILPKAKDFILETSVTNHMRIKNSGSNWPLEFPVTYFTAHAICKQLFTTISTQILKQSDKIVQQPAQYSSYTSLQNLGLKHFPLGPSGGIGLHKCGRLKPQAIPISVILHSCFKGSIFNCNILFLRFAGHDLI